MIVWVQLTGDEVRLIGDYENQRWDPSQRNPDGLALGLGQIRPRNREYIVKGLNPKNGQPVRPAPRIRGRRINPSTIDPFLQIWMLRTFLRDCGKTAADAIREEPLGGYGCL